MKLFKFVFATSSCLSLLIAVPLHAQKVEEKDGQVRVIPYPIDSKWLNSWDKADEDGFWKRANLIISGRGQPGRYGNKSFENEKQAYPNAFFGYLAGYREPALKFLQAEDTEARKWHEHTEGIDLYPAFTLKGQVRKYFFFGPEMEPEYRERMKRGMNAWTKSDPRNTPHPVYKVYNPKIEGWTPERFGNRQLDGRRTDNLFGMTTTATFLFAEESGNKETMESARNLINRYVWSLYHIGMGEWDSATYLGHTISGSYNLYDFAKDQEMKGVAKAALDWMFTPMALKYFHGGMVRPTKRDNAFHNTRFGDNQSRLAWLYFGDVPGKLEVAPRESDQVHAILSAYRPPQALVAMARKEFKKPVC